jgi:hypothetical protein
MMIKDSIVTHDRRQMLREIGSRRTEIVWQLCFDEDIFAITSPVRLNVAARITVPESL